MPFLRRSARASLSNKRYNNDVSAEIVALFSSDSEINPAGESEDTEDDEFGEQDAVAAEEDEQDMEENEISLGDGHSSDRGSDGNADADFEDDIVDFSSQSRRQAKRRKIDTFGNSKFPWLSRRGADLAQGATHSRGLTESHHGESREKQILYSIGPGTEDLAAYIRTRDKWANHGPLPSRKISLKNGGKGGLAYSFYYLEEKRQKEKDKGWEWYYKDGGRSIFKKDQKFVKISFNDTQIFSPRINFRCNLIYGPIRNQKYYSLEAFHTLQLKDCWNAVPHYRNLSKEGFIIPVDGKVQCLEWIPNQDDNIQYLCTVAQKASFQNTEEFKNDVNANQQGKTISTQSYRSCMLIWELRSLNTRNTCGDEKIIGQRDSFTPYIRANMAWDWGDLKRMQWCPVPAPNSLSDVEEEQVYLGLMAGIWADGFIRVLDLSLSKRHDHEQECIRVKQAAFESRPPGTTCTNLTWLSSSSIAASCANGFVAIWDLSSILISRLKSGPNLPLPNPRPWFYHCLHQSYILNITSGYPSRPHFIFTSSMDGHIRLTDTRNPIQDFALTQRQRVSLPPLLWYDHSQSILSTDDNLLLKSTPLRRLYSSTSLGRCEALVTDIASSLIHPIILAGCADGRVWAMNPLKRPKSGKGETWQICWFGHVWRRGLSLSDIQASQQEQPFTEGDASLDDGEGAGRVRGAGAGVGVGARDPDAMDLDVNTSTEATVEKTREEILREPLCRIVDGYKMVKAGLGGNEERAKGRNTTSTTIAVHEQLTAITKVAWNPNLRFGTWAAAATASGILRIEDMAADLNKENV